MHVIDLWVCIVRDSTPNPRAGRECHLRYHSAISTFLNELQCSVDKIYMYMYMHHSPNTHTQWSEYVYAYIYMYM